MNHAHLAVLYENSDWMTDLFDALDHRGVAYDAIDLSRTELPAQHDYAVVFNRVSPSAGSRGHGEAIDLAHAWITRLTLENTRVVNGASFELEMSKQRQHEVIENLGLNVPRTTVLRDERGHVHEPADDFPFPAIAKPDTGGSGEGVRFVGSRRDLESALEGTMGPMLLQQFVTAPTGDVTRLEFIDGALVYAMRARPDNTFNLCPADGCERPAFNPDREASVTFEHATDIPATAIDEARAIVQASGLDVGGVEYIETIDGTRFYFDINATSTYRADVSRAAGVDARAQLVDFLEGEITSTLSTCAALMAA